MLHLVVTLASLYFAIPGGPQQHKGASDSGKLYWQLREGHIWLATHDDMGDSSELCSVSYAWGNLHVYFAPNDQSIIVEDGGPSVGVTLRMFRRGKGVQFIEEEGFDSAVQRAALRRFHVPNRALDHSYTSLEGWLDGGKGALIGLRGKGQWRGQRVHIDWLGIYLVRSGKFTSNLEVFNKDASYVGKMPDDR
ncbi:MAG TPA: hypothetical protein VGC85_08415 [Chthoniobacterales bacterium]|jgi:hypothetical protein